MEKYPEICVVIPVYNCEKYVGETIESILCQPCKDIHIVLVNDGSSDSSAEICDRYAQQNDRIHVLHQENAGVSAARNKGIEYVLSHHPDSAYIAFLDADDKWHKNCFTEEIMKILKCGYDFVGFQTARCNNAVTRYAPLSAMEEGLHKGGNRSVWLNAKQTFGAAFYAVSVIAEYNLRFVEGLKVNEDLIFSMQFKYLAASIYLCNKLLYLYRNNVFSASHRKVHAVAKYEPVILAYLKSDELMAPYQNEQRGILMEGRAMAAVYIVEVYEEHYKVLGAKKEIDQMMERNSAFGELITSPFACNRPDSGLRWQEMNAHPIRFRMKYGIRGIALCVTQAVYRFLMRFPVAGKHIEKIRYPIDL